MNFFMEYVEKEGKIFKVLVLKVRVKINLKRVIRICDKLLFSRALELLKPSIFLLESPKYS